MKYKVKAHESYSKTGRLEHIPEHMAHENENIHQHHLRRLSQEIAGLQEQKARG